MSRIDRRTLSLLGLSALLAPRVLAQEAYPSRPIRVVIGFTAGAASDVIGRTFANAAGPILGQQFVVENKPGAGSSIAAQFVARAPKDGYTLFVPALSSLLYEIVNATPVDINRDFTPVAPLAKGPFVLVVDPRINVRTLADFIAYAKERPGKVLFGSVGSGSLPHLSAVMFAQRAGLDLVHIPYQGSPQITQDMMAGRITMAFNIPSSCLGQIGAGDLAALGIAANKRLSVLPDVPTMAEAGMPDFDASLWLGLLAPAGTPRPIIDKLNDAARKAMHLPETVEALRKQGYEPLDADPDQFAAFVRSETARWSDAARAAGLKS